MNSTFHRLTAPVFARIPDISGVPPRRRVAIGVVASLLFHSLLILVIVILGAIAPQRVEFAKSKLKQREIELTILPPPPDETVLPFTLAQTPDQPFLDSRGLQIARDAALNAIFQSDENMQAASELPATGDIPLPSQGGRDRPFNAFQSQKSLLGAATDLFPTAPDTPPPQPQVSPAPNDPKLAQDSVPAPPAPAATPPPKSVEKEIAAATPPPLKTVTKPKDDEIAVAPKAAATPPPVSKILSSTPPPKIRPVEQQAMLTTPVPRSKTAAKSGYQPEQEENRIEGSISNRGKKSVDAVATPLAKYRKQVNDAIGFTSSMKSLTSLNSR